MRAVRQVRRYLSLYSFMFATCSLASAQDAAVSYPIENIEKLLSSQANVADLNNAISQLSEIIDVVKEEKRFETSPFFVKIYKDVLYKSYSKNLCDLIVLANDRYIVNVCFDKGQRLYIAESSGALAKKTQQDYKLTPAGRGL